MLYEDFPERKKPTQTFTEKLLPLVQHQAQSWTDSLILLTISFWYFFFTGLALVLSRKLPRGWLQIATTLSKRKIAQKIEETLEEKVEAKKPRFKVVDLESRSPVLN